MTFVILTKAGVTALNKLSSNKNKLTVYTELCYLFGLIAMSLGTAMIAVANIGVALPVVPAHVIHGLLHDFHWITLGMIEIACQVVLFVMLSVICRKIKRSFLISMGTGVVYGVLLDLFIELFELLPHGALTSALVFGGGLISLIIGEILLHYTYVQSEFYEFFVHELSAMKKWRFFKVKITFELILCIVGVIVSFAFHGVGEVHGLGIGTLICTLCIIPGSKIMGALLNKNVSFVDGFKIREFFRD